MKCQACGADNPEGSEYCSLCLKGLSVPGTESPFTPQPGVASRDDSYMAPGEWRGDADELESATSKIVASKIRNYRNKIIIYGTIIVVVIVWLALSFTVWWTVSPREISMKLIEAINARNPEEFNAAIMPQSRTAGEMLYDSAILYLGDSGKYENIKLEVIQDDAYTAHSYVESGVINGIHGSETIERSGNLAINLENHEGVWYVNPTGTDLIP